MHTAHVYCLLFFEFAVSMFYINLRVWPVAQRKKKQVLLRREGGRFLLYKETMFCPGNNFVRQLPMFLLAVLYVGDYSVIETS